MLNFRLLIFLAVLWQDNGTSNIIRGLITVSENVCNRLKKRITDEKIDRTWFSGEKMVIASRSYFPE